MSKPTARARHRRRTLFLVASVLLLVFGATIAAVVAAKTLDQFGFLRFPLGYYLLAQGLLIGIVAACFWAASRQEQIDLALSESEEI